VTDPAERARAWLHDTYGELVTLGDAEPVTTTERALLFGCRYAEAQEPMLAATICVPRDGTEPFPVSNADPLDEEFNLSGSAETRPWRLNARNCVVAADAAVDRRPASALPWRPADEAPGWWDRLLATHFPGAEVSTCETWAAAAKSIVDGGSGTRGVVWLRRRLDGRELTGHLLYADFSGAGAVFLDGQRGSLAKVDDTEVGELVLARFHRQPGEQLAQPWEAAADEFTAAVGKANDWLRYVYQGEAELVSPDPSDETERGWLFACTTRRFLDSGDWRDQMLDAAVVVPKAAGQAPFGLPNRDPWTYLRDWNAGKPDLPQPPEPADAAWFGPTTKQLGTVAGVRAHQHWPGALEEISALPERAPALVWVRRKDSRGRETVGHLLWAVNEGQAIQLIDPMHERGQPIVDPAPFELRVIRVN
jgi:hypothetical protein